MDLEDAISELLNDICVEFGRPLIGHGLIITQWNIVKRGKRTNFYVICLAAWFTSSFDAISTMCKLQRTRAQSPYELRNGQLTKWLYVIIRHGEETRQPVFDDVETVLKQELFWTPVFW